MALLLFRLVSALVLLPFGDKFNRLVAAVCRVDMASRDPDNITLMLATSHTLFNLCFSVAVLPFCHHGVFLIRRIIPLTAHELAAAAGKKPKRRSLFPRSGLHLR